MRIPTILLALPLLVLPACMQMKETVKIEKTGKGTIVLHTVVDKKMANGMSEMAKGMGWLPPEGFDLLAVVDPERIKKSLEGKEGLEVKSATRSVDDEAGTITLHLEIAFDSLQALYASGAVIGVSANLEKLEDGNYRFTRSLFAENLPKEGDLESQQMIEGMLQLMQPYLQGLTFGAELTLPTAIVETSGEKLDERRVRWEIDFDHLVSPAARTQSVVFSGDGLAWEPFETKAGNLVDRVKESVPSGPITPSEPQDAPDAPDEPDETK